MISGTYPKYKEQEIESLKPFALTGRLSNELEDFNVKNFLDKLHDQKKMLQTQLADANRSLDDFGGKMTAQTNSLR